MNDTEQPMTFAEAIAICRKHKPHGCLDVSHTHTDVGGEQSEDYTVEWTAAKMNTFVAASTLAKAVAKFQMKHPLPEEVAK